MEIKQQCKNVILVSNVSGILILYFLDISPTQSIVDLATVCVPPGHYMYMNPPSHAISSKRHAQFSNIPPPHYFISGGNTEDCPTSPSTCSTWAATVQLNLVDLK
jgi:hypothetical protein